MFDTKWSKVIWWKSCAGTKVWRLFLPQWGLRCGAREGASWLSLQNRWVFATAAWCQPGGRIFFSVGEGLRESAQRFKMHLLVQPRSQRTAAGGPKTSQRCCGLDDFWSFSCEAKVVRITSVAEVQNNPVLPGQEKWPWVQSDANWYSLIVISMLLRLGPPKNGFPVSMWLRYVGRIKSFSQDTGYGFITCDETQCPQLGGQPFEGRHPYRTWILEWTDFQGSKSSIVTSSSTISSSLTKPRPKDCLVIWVDENLDVCYSWAESFLDGMARHGPAVTLNHHINHLLWLVSSPHNG